ncbi:hypothetical protein Back11_33900 [Paenibacillus baekrokdamisoli]|uniref:Uncharacterized protein n=1 Tax=Paenibacillus baekrokdamisoli TaxID=1712516 RepID=A0A3G9J108_9BACL|nr:cache domain-containing protein [Paenibacillus baekrokdamisoli]MBB3073372.1 hypothetical protein [Paenibacillus baekrokdamisoli]BBH22045.1 hypothetical protein Back11_33900 [Paenibacillus baekrokdamisoli]
MFRVLGKRIKIILILVVMIYIGLASYIVFRIIESRSMDMQHQLSVQYTEQQNKNAQLYLQWLEETTRLVLNHPGLQDALQSNHYDDTISPVLDGIRSSNLDISAIVIYGEQGAVYSTSSISALKPFADIKQDTDFSRFVTSKKTSQWTIQSPEKLVSISSDPRQMLFYMEKISDESGKLRGILFLETNLSKLYDFYRSSDQTIYGNNQIYFFTENNQLQGADKLGSEVKEEVRRTADLQSSKENMIMRESRNGMIMLYRLYKSNDRMVILINTDKLNEYLKWLQNTLLIVNSVIALLFILLIIQLSSSISEPLKQLYRKMRSTMQEP